MSSLHISHTDLVIHSISLVHVINLLTLWGLSEDVKLLFREGSVNPSIKFILLSVTLAELKNITRYTRDFVIRRFVMPGLHSIKMI